MTTQVSYPGVYIEEVSSGVRTITGVATSITAFLGRAVRGPVNEATTITSYADFERTFGGLRYEYPMSYAVRDFYQNGGGQAVVVRLTGAGAVAAVAAVDGGMTISAVSSGEWGNSLRYLCDSVGVSLPHYFNFRVYEMVLDGTITKPVLREVIRNVSCVAASPRRIDKVLAIESTLLRAAVSADTDPTQILAAIPADVTASLKALSTGANGGALAITDYNGSEDTKTGIHALDNADLINLVCLPPDVRGGNQDQAVLSDALAYCTKRRAMLIVDPHLDWDSQAGVVTLKNDPRGQLNDSTNGKIKFAGSSARNAMIFFPRIRQADPERKGQIDTFVPCGMIAGIMARTDATRGVWKAPAGLDASLNGIHSLSVKLTDAENGILNQVGINCLRSFPASGNVVWGSRTLRGDDQLADEWKYIPVRRTALFIEESVFRGTQWAVFEPNDEPLWAQLRLNLGSFMHDLFRQGAFQGRTPREAYFVKCDKETTTQSDINHGIVNVIIGFAPLKPAEFVVIKLTQMAGQIEV